MSAQFPTRLYIDGEWVSADDTFDVINPATEEVLARVHSATPAHALRALDAASRAQADFAAWTPRQRADLLYEIYERVIERADEFAQCMSAEMGKPLDQARSEVTYGAEFLRWHAEEAAHLRGSYFPTPEGTLDVLLHRRPIGPCLLITPWNFPLAMATRKLAPALAAGCTTILKPASLTPLTSALLVSIIDEAGAPAGVVNLLPSKRAADISSQLLADPRLRKVSFTGSTKAGSALIAASAPNVQRCSMELGGLAPFIVHADADLETAIDAAVATKMRNMGQACNAASRFFVHDSLLTRFTEGLIERMSQLTMGDGRDSVDVGPLVSRQHRRSVDDLVRRGIEAGGRLALGGKIPAGTGFFYPPTVITHCAFDNPLMNEEVFGPVAAIAAFSDDEEVTRAANATSFGLAGYVHTTSPARIRAAIERLEVGMIGINSATTSNAASPFGGVKASGLGREGGPSGIDEYLETIAVATPRVE
ncbi:MAG: NAD-dependent succinate-semialdehyde dehydrogenase [Actinomycetaceae bacterium]|nr:NAD-dependent succinate-semialdehyde dehydrogenase [Actinomycetaceae bacterium]